MARSHEGGRERSRGRLRVGDRRGSQGCELPRAYDVARFDRIRAIVDDAHARGERRRGPHEPRSSRNAYATGVPPDTELVRVQAGGQGRGPAVVARPINPSRVVEAERAADAFASVIVGEVVSKPDGEIVAFPRKEIPAAHRGGDGARIPIGGWFIRHVSRTACSHSAFGLERVWQT